MPSFDVSLMAGWRRGFVLLVCAASTSLPAQSPPRPDGWLPRNVQWPRGGTPAERATAMATLERFEQMLVRMPGLARPEGFEILPQFAGGHRPLGQGGTPIAKGLIRYNVGLMMFFPSRATAEGSVCISFIVNDDAPTAQHRDANGREFFIEGDRGTPIGGATQVLGALLDDQKQRSGASVIFTAGGVQPWRQATREEFINALIFEAEGKDGAKSAELQAAFAKTPYQEWTEGAAQRKRERDETIAQARQLQGAAAAEKIRQQFEANEHEVTERLRKDDGAVRERFATARVMIAKGGDDLRATLAAMTPAERRMPALVNNALTTGPLVSGYRLTAEDIPSAWRVLSPNYDFWRARRSPVEVRSIRATFVLSRTCLRPAVQRAVREAFNQMDWAVVRSMLEAPT